MTLLTNLVTPYLPLSVIQIDDFLNGKFPLSVAIRVGESVVVVNLHRAKVEEIEMEPPPNKKRCVRARRPSNHDDGVNYLESTSSTTKHASLSSRESYQYLNSNHSASELMRAGDMSATTTHRSRRKSHRTLKGRDILAESRHHHHHHRVLGSHDHSSAAYPLAQPDRSMLTYTRDLPGAPMETSVAMSAPAPMETPSRTSIPQAVPIISKDAPVVAPVTVSPELVETKVAASSKEHEKSVDAVSCCSEECMEVSSDTPKSSSTVFTTDLSEQDIVPSTQGTDCHEGDSPTSSTSPDSSAIVCSGHSKSKSVSRSVQTDPEPSTNAKKEGRETRISSRKDGRVISRREVKLPESGISMKRKAVMEAISEILKKMYANTEKGRLPGSFKGRFSSEFTCDSDMREILHSKTTMTSYGSEGDDPNKSGSGEASGTNLLGGNNANLSKAKLKEHQQLKDKVANLKWRMQHNRALKMAKRKGERSPCGWMEALNCDMPRDKPKPINRSGYCGLKRGFLLADDF